MQISKDTSSTTENINTRILFKEEALDKIKSENVKLKGEVGILRQNLLTLEKENINLKNAKTQLSKHNFLNDKNKELEMLKLQFSINENKPSKFKNSDNSNEINIKWALQHTSSDLNFQLLPFTYDRLKFYNDFFYNDFYQFNTQIILQEIKARSKINYKEWLDFYVLFSCKIDVFNEFFELVFINDHFIDKKIELFNETPLDWIINWKDGEVFSVLKEFICKNYLKMRYFIYRILTERPFIANLILNSITFTKMIENKDNISKFLIESVCKNGGLNMIDRTNFHLLEKNQLKMLYKDNYMDI